MTLVQTSQGTYAMGGMDEDLNPLGNFGPENRVKEVQLVKKHILELSCIPSVQLGLSWSKSIISVDSKYPLLCPPQTIP